jgi:CBS domain-containing protein
MKRWTVADVMSRDVVTAHPEAGFQDIADLLVRHGISAVPIVDHAGAVIGMVSEADLIGRLEYSDRVPHHPLAARRIRSRHGRRLGNTASELMSSPAVTITPEATVSRAARLMDAARVKRIPVVTADHLIGIVSRRDLVRLYARPDPDLRNDVYADLRNLGIDRTDVTVSVDRGVVTLHGTVDRKSAAAIAFSVVSATPGVVDVVNELIFTVDDAGDPVPTGSGAR